MSLVNSKTGKIKFIAKNVASEIGVNPTTFIASMKRLKDNLIVSSFTEDDGEKYYMINPYLVSVGRKNKFMYYVKKFNSTFT